jgi:hypothetical protein
MFTAMVRKALSRKYAAVETDLRYTLPEGNPKSGMETNEPTI